MFGNLAQPKIIIPHAGEPSALQASILENQYHLVTRYRRLEGDFGYAALLAELWAEGEDFILIEHDILPWPGAIEELQMCECAWGSYSYITNRHLGVQHMLGCTKITSRMIEKLPRIWAAGPLVPWWHLDKVLRELALDVELEPHLHRPPVIHINPRELAAV